MSNLDSEYQPDQEERRPELTEAIESPKQQIDGGDSFHSSLSSEEETSDMPFFQMGAFGTEEVKQLKEVQKKPKPTRGRLQSTINESEVNDLIDHESPKMKRPKS